MLLAIDIGNSNISVGLFVREKELKFLASIDTDSRKTADQISIDLMNLFTLYGCDIRDVSGAIFSSVVPPMNFMMEKALTRLLGKPPMVVGAGIRTGLNIRMEFNSQQLGADIVANAVAALEKYPVPIIMIDMGTATIISYISEKRSYEGGLMFPGVRLSLDALSHHTAQLPNISLEHPRQLIGKNTEDCMRSGIVYGTAAMLDGVIDRIREMVAYAKSYCDDIEFSAEDASRSDWAFLAHCYSTAVAAGATTLNVPDTVGYSTPQEMYDLITYLRENIEGVEHVDISVHCHNDLGMAVANSLECVRAGATQVECTVNGIGERAGNASLEEIIMALRTRKDFYDAETGVNTKQIYRSSKLLSNITGVPIPPSKAIVGANAFAHESGIHQHGVIANARTYEIMNSTDVGIPQNTMVLGKHSGKHALREKLESMGYELSDEELESVFTRFKDLADKKKSITSSDIEALVLHRQAAVQGSCQLVSHVVNTGHGVPNISCIKLQRGDEQIEDVAIGTGPLDASFKAINRMLQMDVKLESFSLNAVTDGEDAIGEAVVKVSGPDGRSYTGSGLSTDIIESSIRAYVNGINKIMESGN